MPLYRSSCIVLLSMADGTMRTREVTRISPGLDPALATDESKLKWIRTAPLISLQGVLNMANRIHDVALRDAALGHILKTRMRQILSTPVLIREIGVERQALYEVADMMSDAGKRTSMFIRIDTFEKTSGKTRRSD